MLRLFTFVNCLLIKIKFLLVYLMMAAAFRGSSRIEILINLHLLRCHWHLTCSLLSDDTTIIACSSGDSTVASQWRSDRIVYLLLHRN